MTAFEEKVEKIFTETRMALADTFTDRVRFLGDSNCKAGIGAVLTYLSAKSDLGENDLKQLSVGKLPPDYERTHFEKHLKQLNEKLSKDELSFCSEAFLSGVSTSLAYLLKTAKFRDIDLLSAAAL